MAARKQLGTRSETGHAMVEVALMSPWILLLFIGIVDVGFYCYAAICTQNAARVAALHTSSSPAAASDSTGACAYALGELKKIPNANTLTTCGSLPVVVTTQCIPDCTAPVRSRVSVTYRTQQLFPIPFLTSQLTMQRAVEMTVDQNN
jgi:Flp pilus assembly protein TadG